ncbi:CoA-binding protein [Streptomyces violaceusniger]|uniref:CoA-binding protein n=1 Tax=Streptomyces violaceusniger TaxID=68280 RepID=UPI0036AB8E54
MIRRLLEAGPGLLVQGITGRQGQLETRWMLDSGVKVAAGVTPGKGGSEVHGVPVFDTVAAAVAATGAQVAMSYAPPQAAADAVAEAAQAGLELIVVSSENIPRHRWLRALDVARAHNCRVIGPNSQGVVVPGVGRIGCPGGNEPWQRFAAGSVGIVSRSGGMASELAMLVRTWGWGTSVQMSIGGMPTAGTTLTEGVELVAGDPLTRAVLVFGEPSSSQEVVLARAVADGRIELPIIAMVAGRAGDSLPTALPFGHAPRDADGATVQEKCAALADVGVLVARSTHDIRAHLAEALPAAAFR